MTTDTPQRAALLLSQQVLRGLRCIACKEEGANMAKHCSRDADCDAGFNGIVANDVAAAIEATTKALSMGSETPADFDLQAIWVVRRGAQWITRAGALTTWLHEAKHMSEDGAKTEALVYQGFPMSLQMVLADPKRHQRQQRLHEAEGVFLAAILAANTRLKG